MTSWWRNNPAYPDDRQQVCQQAEAQRADEPALIDKPQWWGRFIDWMDERQLAYEQARAAWCAQWRQSDAEDWCARKELQPGTYEQLDAWHD